jgi:hypothetical protein
MIPRKDLSGSALGIFARVQVPAEPSATRTFDSRNRVMSMSSQVLIISFLRTTSQLLPINTTRNSALRSTDSRGPLTFGFHGLNGLKQPETCLTNHL